MNELAERYLKYHDEQMAIDLVRCARCISTQFLY